MPWPGLLKARLVDWHACAFFMPLLRWLARRYPVDRLNWARTLPLHLLVAVPIAISKEAIFVAIGEIFRPGVFHLPTILAEDLGHEVIAVWAFADLAHAWAFHERSFSVKVAAANPAASLPAAVTVDHIAVHTGNGLRMIRLDAIACIDSHGNYARLGPGFLREHRRVIVRVDKVQRLEQSAAGKSP
ncbi:MAG: hypothetical protein ACREVI_15195 [Steroidobacteraceae bacterium]